VIGLVFGLIGMLGSFIPCLGSLPFFVGIPAAIVSGIALAIAYARAADRSRIRRAARGFVESSENIRKQSCHAADVALEFEMSSFMVNR
jgi:uncharacterized membrane protein